MFQVGTSNGAEPTIIPCLAKRPLQQASCMGFCLSTFCLSCFLLVLLRPRSRGSLLWQSDAGRNLPFTLFSVFGASGPQLQPRYSRYAFGEILTVFLPGLRLSFFRCLESAIPHNQSTTTTLATEIDSTHRHIHSLTRSSHTLTAQQPRRAGLLLC